MKQLLILILSLLSVSLSAQNTCLIFDESSKQAENFDGDKVAYYKGNEPNQKEIIEIFEKFHSNGQIAEKGLIVNNKPEGLWKKYDKDGNLIAKIKYKEGIKTGKWIIWNDEGQILAKGRYNNEGDKTGKWVYYSSLDEKYLNKSF